MWLLLAVPQSPRPVTPSLSSKQAPHIMDVRTQLNNCIASRLPTSNLLCLGPQVSKQEGQPDRIEAQQLELPCDGGKV